MEKMKPGSIFLLFCIFLLNTYAGYSQEITKASGTVSFKFIAENQIKEIPIWFYKPARFDRRLPIAFVLHGIKRNAKKYLKYWKDFADRTGCLIVAPEFKETYFKGSQSYNCGNVFNRRKELNATTDWTFVAIDKIFESLKKANGLSCQHFFLYGHSAGAQFVHRYIWFMENTKCGLAIAANSGFYTFPDVQNSYPYGFKNLPSCFKKLENSFKKNLIILLGDQDIDTQHKYLNRSKRAMIQGINRFERGKRFFNTCEAESLKRNSKFYWKKIIVPGAGHSNKLMMKAAEKLMETELGKR